MSTSAFPPSRSFSLLHPPAPIQKNNPFGNVRYRFMPDCRCPRQVVLVLIRLFLSSPGCFCPHQAVSVLTRLFLSSLGCFCPHQVVSAPIMLFLFDVVVFLSSPGCFYLNRTFYALLAVSIPTKKSCQNVLILTRFVSALA